MRRLGEIVAKLLMARDIFKSQGLEKHASDLDARAGALIFNGAGDLEEVPGTDSTSRATTSDTGRTVTARMTPQQRAEMRRLRRKMKSRKPARKKWVCCDPAEKRRTRKGMAWVSVCHFRYMSGKNRGEFGATSVISYETRRPSSVTVDGGKRKLSVCRGGRLQREKAKFQKPTPSTRKRST